MRGEQIIPPAALDDPEAIEMLRVWIAQKGLHCSLNIGVYEAGGISEARAWGIICADILRHISGALAQTGDKGADTILDALREELLKELENPTSQTKGDFISLN